MSRRVQKQIYEWSGDQWLLANTHSFTYDGWNLIAETGPTTNYYFWGLDLSGSLQGAGGVGGLLATVKDGQAYTPCYDANANISDYMTSDGTVAAHFEYDPYGNTTQTTGPEADNFAFRFSTKYLDTEAGLYYYGYRFYDPEMGRWLSRDPLGERGGVNLYLTCANALIGGCDALGLRCILVEPDAKSIKINVLKNADNAPRYDVNERGDIILVKKKGVSEEEWRTVEKKTLMVHSQLKQIKDKLDKGEYNPSAIFSAVWRVLNNSKDVTIILQVAGLDAKATTDTSAYDTGASDVIIVRFDAPVNFLSDETLTRAENDQMKGLGPRLCHEIGIHAMLAILRRGDSLLLNEKSVIRLFRELRNLNPTLSMNVESQNDERGLMRYRASDIIGVDIPKSETLYDERLVSEGSSYKDYIAFNVFIGWKLWSEMIK